MSVLSGVALCLIGAAVCLLLSGYKSEYSMLVAVCVGVIVLSFALSEVSPAFSQLSELLAASGVDSGYLKIALKSLGICYITGFVSDICRDFGQSAIAAKAELVGKCAIFLLCLPLLEAVIDFALAFIGEV